MDSASAAGGDRLDLRGTAGRVGALAWWEHRCFEVVGGWVDDTDDTAVQVHFAAVSRHHAWRAATLEERLPRLRELPLEELVTSPGAGAALAVARAAATTGSPARLAVLQRVLLARLGAGHAAVLAAASPVGDAALRRWLAKVLDDLAEDRTAGDLLLAARLDGVGPVDAATAAVRELDELLAAHPGTLPPA